MAKVTSVKLKVQIESTKEQIQELENKKVEEGVLDESDARSLVYLLPQALDELERDLSDTLKFEEIERQIALTKKRTALIEKGRTEIPKLKGYLRKFDPSVLTTEDYQMVSGKVSEVAGEGVEGVSLGELKAILSEVSEELKERAESIYRLERVIRSIDNRNSFGDLEGVRLVDSELFEEINRYVGNWVVDKPVDKIVDN